MAKPHILYTAIRDAVNDYNERHYYSREMLADVLGYIGRNAAVQFSSAINPNNQDKSLSDSRKCSLLHAMDTPARIKFFETLMRPFDLKPCLMDEQNDSSDISVIIDLAEISAGEIFRTVKSSLEDDELDIDELREIVDKATETMHMYEELILAAQRQIEEAERL